MGRPAIGKQMTFRLDDETRARIDAVLRDGEKYAVFLRDAAMREVERREAAKSAPRKRKT